MAGSCELGHAPMGSTNARNFLTEELSAYEEVLCSMELASGFYGGDCSHLGLLVVTPSILEGGCHNYGVTVQNCFLFVRQTDCSALRKCKYMFKLTSFPHNLIYTSSDSHFGA